MTLKVAITIAPDQTLPNEHFGQAPAYALFDLGPDGLIPQGTLSNPTTGTHDHDAHGELSKAKSVTQVLASKGVQVMVGRQFGANITRMIKRFVPVRVVSADLDEVGALLVEAHDRIQAEWEAGPTRKALNLR